jgi:hypothetical protein
MLEAEEEPGHIRQNGGRRLLPSLGGVRKLNRERWGGPGERWSWILALKTQESSFLIMNCLD